LGSKGGRFSTETWERLEGECCSLKKNSWCKEKETKEQKLELHNRNQIKKNKKRKEAQGR
jgi:hypothetical protein